MSRGSGSLVLHRRSLCRAAEQCIEAGPVSGRLKAKGDQNADAAIFQFLDKASREPRTSTEVDEVVSWLVGLFAGRADRDSLRSGSKVSEFCVRGTLGSGLGNGEWAGRRCRHDTRDAAEGRALHAPCHAADGLEVRADEGRDATTTTTTTRSLFTTGEGQEESTHTLASMDAMGARSYCGEKRASTLLNELAKNSSLARRVTVLDLSKIEVQRKVRQGETTATLAARACS